MALLALLHTIMAARAEEEAGALLAVGQMVAHTAEAEAGAG